MRKTLLSLLAGLAIALPAEAQLQNYAVGDVAPDFTVTDVHGNTHTLYSQTSQGKYVILDFFFTTCPPCQATVPYFSELHEKYGCNAGDLYCLSIDVGDTDAEVIAFENTYGGSFSHAPAVSGNEGGGNAVIQAYSPAAYPTYVLIGPDNKFVSIDIWPVSGVGSFEAAFPSGSNITPMACGAVAIDPAKTLSTITLFPNPAQDQAKLILNLEQEGNLNVEIYNLMGSKVRAFDLGMKPQGELTETLDLRNLATGSYVLKVTQEGALLASHKLTVQH
jgi:thiol-disulfide isomerase/thioredoxin